MGLRCGRDGPAFWASCSATGLAGGPSAPGPGSGPSPSGPRRAPPLLGHVDCYGAAQAALRVSRAPVLRWKSPALCAHALWEASSSAKG